MLAISNRSQPQEGQLSPYLKLIKTYFKDSDMIKMYLIIQSIKKIKVTIFKCRRSIKLTRTRLAK